MTPGVRWSKIVAGVPIPPFDSNLVVPPHLGDPRDPSQLSPYPCDTLEICERFATSSDRVRILDGFLGLRGRLSAQGFTDGVQWIGGSFLEDVEAAHGRSPGDIDCITLYRNVSDAHQAAAITAEPTLFDAGLAKRHWSVDHYPVDIDFDSMFTVDNVRYWIGLFTHRRDGVWKGLLKLDLYTPEADVRAAEHLAARRAVLT